MICRYCFTGMDIEVDDYAQVWYNVDEERCKVMLCGRCAKELLISKLKSVSKWEGAE